MSQQFLSLETLADFDFGKADVAFQLALKAAVLDMQDRPGDPNARKVILTTELRPKLEQDGDVVAADVRFLIESKVPKRSTSPQPAAMTRAGGLLFQSMAPDNPEQTTIDDAPDAGPSS
jgi:hypothetical protein